MITDATDDNARPPEMSGNAALSGTVDNTTAATVDNTAAETIRYLATELLEARRKLKANGRPVPDNWQDYVLGQTKRALAIEDSNKLRALIVEALASIGPRDAVEDMIAAQMLACQTVELARDQFAGLAEKWIFVATEPLQYCTRTECQVGRFPGPARSKWRDGVEGSNPFARSKIPISGPETWTTERT